MKQWCALYVSLYSYIFYKTTLGQFSLIHSFDFHLAPLALMVLAVILSPAYDCENKLPIKMYYFGDRPY